MAFNNFNKFQIKIKFQCFIYFRKSSGFFTTCVNGSEICIFSCLELFAQQRLLDGRHAFFFFNSILISPSTSLVYTVSSFALPRNYFCSVSKYWGDSGVYRMPNCLEVRSKNTKHNSPQDIVSSRRNFFFFVVKPNWQDKSNLLKSLAVNMRKRKSHAFEECMLIR
jgi:hypothetical protein